MTWQLLEGDCLAVLTSMADASVDAVVTDPPYNLSFMGKGWDGTGIAFRAELWAAVLRVLKPGGHLLAFGGARTSHRMTCAIEDAGFEIRDTISWLYGSGFPKSLDVSKAIDKAAGAEREVVGRYQLPNGSVWNLTSDEATPKIGPVGHSDRAGSLAITAPATDAAKQWDGWGTALKPAHEPIVLARKPLAEPTVAANVLTHGTGAINVDGCRVGFQSEADRQSALPASKSGPHAGFEGRSFAMRDRSSEDPAEAQNAKGRWPANLILSHAPGCRRVGDRKVKTGTAVNSGLDGGVHNAVYGARRKPSGPDVSYGDEDGTETIAAFECVEGCPVRELDAQSGERPVGRFPAVQNTSGTGRSRYATWVGNIAPARDLVGVGGASRYFNVFEPDAIDEAAPSRCSLCSLLFVPDRGRVASCDVNAGTQSSPVEPSAAVDVPQELQQEGEDRSAALQRSADGVERPGSRTRETTESSALDAVLNLRVERFARSASGAASLCGSCATAIAQSLVAIEHGRSPESPPGPASMPACRRPFLFRNLALVAGGLGDIDTIPTTASLSLWSGFVRDAIVGITTQDFLAGQGLGPPPFRYQAKASRRERNEGLDHLPQRPDTHSSLVGVLGNWGCLDCKRTLPAGGNAPTVCPRCASTNIGRLASKMDGSGRDACKTRVNNHPTVKPVALCRWLVRLVTPPGDTVLDPFAGSGSTGVAALREGFGFIGIERDAEYADICRARLQHEAPQIVRRGMSADLDQPVAGVVRRGMR